MSISTETRKKRELKKGIAVPLVEEAEKRKRGKKHSSFKNIRSGG